LEAQIEIVAEKFITDQVYVTGYEESYEGKERRAYKGNFAVCFKMDRNFTNKENISKAAR